MFTLREEGQQTIADYSESLPCPLCLTGVYYAIADYSEHQTGHRQQTERY